MLSTLELHMHCDCFKKFEDLIYVDDKLPAKTAKITSLENLYMYSMLYVLHAYTNNCIYAHTRACMHTYTRTYTHVHLTHVLIIMIQLHKLGKICQLLPSSDEADAHLISRITSGITPLSSHGVCIRAVRLTRLCN